MIVSIPKPCNEDFKGFQPTKNGGFCAQCQKEVVDFTNKSDAEIKAYFKENGNSCGLFRKKQLDRNMAPSARGEKSLRSLLAIGMLSLVPYSAQAENAPPTKILQGLYATQASRHTVKQQSPSDSTYTIYGTVVDNIDREPLPGVNISVKDTSIEIVSDIDGAFSFNIPAKPNHSPIVLIFSYVGFKDEQVEVRVANSDTQSLNITMVLDTQVLGEVDYIVTGGAIGYRRWSPRGIWYRIRNFFRRK